MVLCSCGTPVVSGVGEGFVVTPENERRWMRRRSDFFTCAGCSRRWIFAELARELAEPSPSGAPSRSDRLR